MVKAAVLGRTRSLLSVGACRLRLVCLLVLQHPLVQAARDGADNASHLVSYISGTSVEAKHFSKSMKHSLSKGARLVAPTAVQGAAEQASDLANAVASKLDGYHQDVHKLAAAIHELDKAVHGLGTEYIQELAHAEVTRTRPLDVDTRENTSAVTTETRSEELSDDDGTNISALLSVDEDAIWRAPTFSAQEKPRGKLASENRPDFLAGTPDDIPDDRDFALGNEIRRDASSQLHDGGVDEAGEDELPQLVAMHEDAEVDQRFDLDKSLDDAGDKPTELVQDPGRRIEERDAEDSGNELLEEEPRERGDESLQEASRQDASESGEVQDVMQELAALQKDAALALHDSSNKAFSQPPSDFAEEAEEEEVEESQGRSAELGQLMQGHALHATQQEEGDHLGEGFDREAPEQEEEELHLEESSAGIAGAASEQDHTGEDLHRFGENEGSVGGGTIEQAEEEVHLGGETDGNARDSADLEDDLHLEGPEPVLQRSMARNTRSQDLGVLVGGPEEAVKLAHLAGGGEALHKERRPPRENRAPTAEQTMASQVEEEVQRTLREVREHPTERLDALADIIAEASSHAAHGEESRGSSLLEADEKPHRLEAGQATQRELEAILLDLEVPLLRHTPGEHVSLEDDLSLLARADGHAVDKTRSQEVSGGRKAGMAGKRRH